VGGWGIGDEEEVGRGYCVVGVSACEYGRKWMLGGGWEEGLSVKRGRVRVD